jgi:hypothetical protein
MRRRSAPAQTHAVRIKTWSGSMYAGAGAGTPSQAAVSRRTRLHQSGLLPEGAARYCPSGSAELSFVALPISDSGARRICRVIPRHHPQQRQTSAALLRS